jgi:hypothetical protein
MEKGIDYYYGAILEKIKPEIEQILNEEMDFLEKINAIAQLKFEAFKTATAVAGMVAVHMFAPQEEQ